MRHMLAAAVLLALIAPHALAGGGPEGVIVVVNEDSWASMAVANEFIHLRRIPAGNVVYLKDLPGFEHTDVDAFRDRLLAPVLAAIRDRGLEGRIDCVAWSADLPWAVSAGKDVAGRELPKFITQTAALNGLTYLYELVQAKDIAYLGMNSNAYLRRPKPLTQGKPPTSEEVVAGQFVAGLIQNGNWADAEAALRRLLDKRPDAPDLWYNLACVLARQNKADAAVAALEKSVEAGWGNAAHASQDADLEPLRERKDFKALLERMKQPMMGLAPSVAFSGAASWAPNGDLAEPGAGRRYMLSTMLAVTSGRGLSVAEAVENLRRSAGADGAAPPGTIYFMQNGDVRSTTRQWAFASAAALLGEMGVKAEVLQGTLPKDKPDVAGLVVGAAGFDWPKSGSTILPGAICEHLTSTGGVMNAGAGQTALTEFLRAGAAGASGAVTEPYAIQAKFPLAFMHVHYAAGCSLAEAFYQSVAGPYQLLIVGDPLCRPWAKIPRVTIAGAKPGQALKGKVTLTPAAEGDVPVSRFEWFIDGRPGGTCKPGESFTLPDGLSDGWHEVRAVAVASGPVATRGFCVMPVVLANHGQALKVTVPAAKEVAWGTPLKTSASMPGAREIRFLHNGRALASVAGEKGDVTIDTARLGLGPVAIQAVAHMPPTGGAPGAPAPSATSADTAKTSVAEGTLVAAAPVEMDIIPPTALPAQPKPPEGETAKGLVLELPGGKRMLIESTRDGAWMTKAGLDKGQAFTLDGWFTAPRQEVYQFQVRPAGEMTVAVDGREIGRAPGGRWTMLPVHLAQGPHRLTVTGVFEGRPSMDIRFGGPGAAPLDAERFSHTGQAEAAAEPEKKP